MRFIGANIAVRLLKREVAVRFPNGTRLLISPRMKGAAHFINPGLCEFEEMAFVLHFLRPDDLFVDIGANVGAYMVLASGVAGARTIAFEPNPSTFEFLSRNVTTNRLERLATPVNAAVGEARGELSLTNTLGTENYVSREGESGPTVRVKVETLDSVLRDKEPLLIKADVEGFETAVFAGAAETLRKTSLQAMIIERNALGERYGFDESALHARIRSHGFMPCAYLPMERLLRRIENEAKGNIIYVRDFETVQKRLREARAFQFGGRSI